MALIKCPECGKEISDKAKSCVGCGWVLDVDHGEKSENNIVSEQKLKRKNISMMAFIIGIVCVLIIAIIITFFVLKSGDTKRVDEGLKENNIESIEENTENMMNEDIVETSIEEDELEGKDTEVAIEKGSRQSPYQLGEKVTLSVFASNYLYDVNMIPATIEITINEYNEEYVECEICLSDCETDSPVDFLVTLFPKIIDSQMTEIGQYTITREPEGLSSSISMYNGGKTTGYIQLKFKDDVKTPQYVVLQYYKCSDINKPKEETDWTETWFELSGE